MNSIVISKPSIKISFNNLITKTNTTEKKTLYQQISESLNSIRINTIVLKDADVTYTNLSDSKPRVNEFKGLVAKVSDIKIDSAAQFDKTRFYYTKDIHFQLKNYHFITRDSLYNISLGEISSSTSSRFFKLRKLKVKPLYSEMEFSRKYKTQHDRYDLYFEEIILQNIDFIGIITEQRLIA